MKKVVLFGSLCFGAFIIYKRRQQLADVHDELLVDALVSSINDNNHSLTGPLGPYRLVGSDGLPYVPPDLPKGQPACSLCRRTFNTFTDQEVHKAKPCFLDTKIHEADVEIIAIQFDESHLKYIGDCIEGLGLTVRKESNGLQSVAVPLAMLEITLRRLYTGQVTKYNLEAWYPCLESLSTQLGRPVTFRTVILPLTDPDLRLIQKLCSVALAQGMGMGGHETNSELAQREAMEDRIDAALQDMPSSSGYFCKFSTRSPKDAVARIQPSDEPEESTISNVKNKMNRLRVTKGFEVMDLITRSQRIFSDISFYFQYRVPNSSSAQLSIVLREWMEDMPFDHEFRCFVHNKTLTAISQYDCYTRFDALQHTSRVEKIRRSIMEFHEVVKGELPYTSYVMDVVVFPNSTKGKEKGNGSGGASDALEVMLIELNPFGPYMSSGAALFNWQRDRDILFGESPQVRGRPPIRVLRNLLDLPPS